MDACCGGLNTVSVKKMGSGGWGWVAKGVQGTVEEVELLGVDQLWGGYDVDDIGESGFLLRLVSILVL